MWVRKVTKLCAFLKDLGASVTQGKIVKEQNYDESEVGKVKFRTDIKVLVTVPQSKTFLL